MIVGNADNARHSANPVHRKSHVRPVQMAMLTVIMPANQAVRLGSSPKLMEGTREHFI